MEPDARRGTLKRRGFMGLMAGLAVGGRTLLEARDARAAVYAARQASGASIAWPEMPKRTLGRTGFEASRLVFGCGASLMFRSRDALLDAAFDAGVNVFDVGYAGYYWNAEENLAPFAGKVRDKIFLISKARAEVEGLADDDEVMPAQASPPAIARPTMASTTYLAMPPLVSSGGGRIGRTGAVGGGRRALASGCASVGPTGSGW